MSEEALKQFTKAALPIAGTYKPYTAKNTNAGLDWRYVQLSNTFVLYYAKNSLVGVLWGDKFATGLIPWEIRDRWGIEKLIIDHAMRVIAAQNGDTLDDRTEIDLVKPHWYLQNHRTVYADRMPYLVKSAIENPDGLTKDLVNEIANASESRFDGLKSA